MHQQTILLRFCLCHPFCVRNAAAILCIKCRHRFACQMPHLRCTAYFLLMGIFDEDEPLPPQITEKADYLKGWADDDEKQEALLCCFEFFVWYECRTRAEQKKGGKLPFWCSINESTMHTHHCYNCLKPCPKIRPESIPKRRPS